MGRAQPAGTPAADAKARRFRLASPAACAVIGVVLLILFIAAVPLAGVGELPRLRAARVDVAA